jgi:hypothetical protein
MSQWKIMKNIRKGIAVQIAAVILMLIFFGILLPFFYLMSNGVLKFQQTYYSSGVFQQNYLTFTTNIIAWWPILGILFPLVIWGILQAQKRRQQDAM